MKKINYNTWAVGKLPKETQRPELDDVHTAGYPWEDPRVVVDMFEKKIATFAGAKYAIAVDSCSNGLFLALKYLEHIPSRRFSILSLAISTPKTKDNLACIHFGRSLVDPFINNFVKRVFVKTSQEARMKYSFYWEQVNSFPHYKFFIQNLL